MTWTIKNK